MWLIVAMYLAEVAGYGVRLRMLVAVIVVDPDCRLGTVSRIVRYSGIHRRVSSGVARCAMFLIDMVCRASRSVPERIRAARGRNLAC